MSDYRHQCEVRHCLSMRIRNRTKVVDYFEDVTKKRGAEAGQKLKADVMQQWDLGNRGVPGHWIEKEI